MDPLTGIVLSTLFSSTMSVFGNSVKQSSLKAQEQEAIRNAQENSRIALFAGRAERDNILRKGRLIEGSDVAKTAGSGISMTGSALDVISQNIQANQRDADMAMYNANLKANSYMRQGYNSAAQFANAQTESNLNMITGIGSSIFKGYSMYQQNEMANDAFAVLKDNTVKYNDASLLNRRNYYDTLYKGSTSVQWDVPGWDYEWSRG